MSTSTSQWKRKSMEDFWGNVSPSEHVLQLYEDHEEFFSVLAGYVSAGLRSGDAVVVIATPNHLAGLEERLRQQGFDLFTLGLRDQYIPLDADETLSQFVVDDWPDPDRKSTRLNSSHVKSSYAVFCLKKKI